MNNSINQSKYDKEVKTLFSKKIKGNFLIKIRNKVFDEIGNDLLKYYPIDFNIVTSSYNPCLYDICKIIVGVHSHHSIFLTKEDILTNHSDESYQKKIVEEVIEKIKLRQYGSLFFRNMQLILGEEFLYFPVPYELFAMCIKSVGIVETAKREFSLCIYYCDILNCALSVLTLMENNFLSNAYPLCRGMIEIYIKILVLQKHPESLGEYIKFCEFEVEQSCCTQEYPDNFNKLYKKNIGHSTTNKINYLHYGWLDCISEYDIKARNRYSIYGIFDYLLKSDDNDMHPELEDILRLYKMCHGYTHGSTIHVKYPLLQYFEISTMLYHIIKTIFTNLHSLLHIEMSDEDKLLLNILDRDFSMLKEQYKKRTAERFESYYALHPL